ncbi:unnamed protein product [Callosobruchus maculatus]|uniref:BTB domain-containing protein n=1 Tax=Callosobruchus maculatus TaxID=64391 RepID=A0A653CHV1_CALMS|nr:unnamed protein product [Callosobruchus maculatus]
MIIMEQNRDMSFHCAELSTEMFQKLYEQKKANRFCDITLFVNNKIIKAHRNVLACSSPYFDSILKHHKIIREQLTISCLDSNIFNSLLNFMYTGDITIHYSNVEELLKLADHFILTKVIEYCIEFLGAKLHLDNCLFTYTLTQKFRLKHLGAVVENWISSHIDEVCKGDEILELSSDRLADFLKNKNFGLTTGKSLSILSQWILQDLDKREKYFERLLKHFPADSLDSGDVFKHLETSMLYVKSEWCLYVFLDYLPRGNWTFTNFKTRYDVLQAKYGQVHSDENESEPNVSDQKIVVTEKEIASTSNCNSVTVKTRLRNQKQLILKKLMLLGLKPSLRMAALRVLTCKKKRITVPAENGNHSEEAEDSDGKVGIKCPICFTHINDSLLLEQHLALSHAKDVTYKCGLCSFVCQYHGDYLNHMKMHFSGPPFKCDFCDYTSDQISKLISHRAHHLEENIYQCTFCSFKCRQKQNFISHMKLHTPDKTYKCDQCSKEFRFKQNLDSHMLNHDADRNLVCDACGFHTKFLSHMIAHRRIHAGDIYRCSYPHCKYTTSKKSQLASHAKTHNGVRPHSCHICGRGFMEKSHLVRHERIHLEEKPFKCSNCDYASSRRDKLKEHFTRHHGENASAKVPYKARPLRNCSTSNGSTKSKSQASHETSSSVGPNNGSFSHSNSNTPVSQAMSSEIQDLIMHHQNHSAAATNLTTANSAYPPFASGGSSNAGSATDPTDFSHHHPAHAHHNPAHAHHNAAATATAAAAAAAAAASLHNQILSGSHAARGAAGGGAGSVASHLGAVSHPALSRGQTATSTAAAVAAAAMMLDPRFHHNSSVPYHPSTTPVSMAMAAVQSSQQIQSAGQPSDYPSTLQNCMTLF